MSEFTDMLKETIDDLSNALKSKDLIAIEKTKQSFEFLLYEQLPKVPATKRKFKHCIIDRRYKCTPSQCSYTLKECKVKEEWKRANLFYA